VFRRFNVGLLSHDRYGHSTVIVRSQKQSPTSRYRLIMALGMLLRQVG
jgi:predicted nucleotide-binding protein